MQQHFLYFLVRFIEHLDNPFHVVNRAFELLQPGGVLIIETPSVEGWDAKFFRKRYWGGWHTPRHWNLYDQHTLEFLLRKNGFEVVEITYLLSPNFWLQSLHHLTAERLAMPKIAKFFDVSFLPALVLATVVDYLQKILHNRTSNFWMVGRNFLSKFGFHEQAYVVFDHLVPAIAEYIPHQEFAQWFEGNQLHNVVITPRAENSWRGFGIRPSIASDS